MSKHLPFTCTVTIPDSIIVNLLVSARESGVYGAAWARFNGCPYKFIGGSDIWRLKLPVTLHDVEEDKPVKYTLDRAAIERGCQLLLTVPKLLCAILEDDTDGPDGDNFLQLCCFGKLVYG